MVKSDWRVFYPIPWIGDIGIENSFSNQFLEIENGVLRYRA